MPIQPDTKDWTWVLDRRCDECGFDARAFPRDEVGDLVRTNASAWHALLERPDVRERPSDDRWSCLEYACHVRDVFRLYDRRLRMMLEEDDPHYPNWDQDSAAIEARYDEQDPIRVASEIEAAGAAVAARFDSVEGDAWLRTGNRSDGARFTVESFARYFVHDPIHHLHDVERGYEVLADRG
ncbi:MAG: DinB family protein [Actinomycetota bacterium]|nr:DinB family protein [Actinomycetota bacterium]